MAVRPVTPDPNEFRFLVSASSNNYVYHYSAFQQTLNKIEELRKTSAMTSQSLAQLRQLEAQVAQQTWGRGYMAPPEKVIAEKSDLWDRSTGRVLVAKRVHDNSLRFLLYKSVKHVLDDVEDNMVWHDPRARNVPYCTKSLYPMTEDAADSACSVYFDLEEEFLEEMEPWDVPTDDELCPPGSVRLPDGDPVAQLSSLEQDIALKEARARAIQAARRTFESCWQKREAEFALRCRWAVALVRQCICARYGMDLAEAPIYWYSACSRKKNSFRIYVPDWRFENVAALSKLMSEVVRPMLDGLDANHPCKKALLRSEYVVKSAGNPYIIDFGVYNKHRQMRGPFQRKNPATDNAFVPYDGTTLGRIPVQSHLVRQYFEPALVCVAAHPSAKVTCYYLRSYPPLGPSEPHLELLRKIWKKTDFGTARVRRLYEHLAWFASSVEKSAHVYRSRGDAKQRIVQVGTFIKDNSKWVLSLALPDGAVHRYGSALCQELLRVFLMILATQIVRYGLTRVPENEGYPDADRGAVQPRTMFGLSCCMGRVFTRTMAYYMPYVRLATGSGGVCSERLEDCLVGRNATALRDQPPPLERYALLVWSHLFPNAGAMGQLTSNGTRGSLMAYEQGEMSKADVDHIWSRDQSLEKKLISNMNGSTANASKDTEVILSGQNSSAKKRALSPTISPSQSTARADDITPEARTKRSATTAQEKQRDPRRKLFSLVTFPAPTRLETVSASRPLYSLEWQGFSN